MADGSTRGGRPIAGPLLVAVIFLAVLGAGAGFSLGSLTRGAHPDAAAVTGGTDPATHGPTATPPSADPPSASASGGKRCLAHTEQQAGVSPLYQVLYLRTAQSEVWICRSGDGTLYYQGHRLQYQGQRQQPGDHLVEGQTSLYLGDVEREGAGYVATNTDPNNGHVTKYHVTGQQLTIVQTWSSDPPEVQPAV